MRGVQRRGFFLDPPTRVRFAAKLFADLVELLYGPFQGFQQIRW
jgi:hypothetical protein